MSSPTIPDVTAKDNPLQETNVTTEPRPLTLHNLLVVYPIVTSIVKNLSFRQLIALAQTDKSCFAFLRGGDWGIDLRRWNSLRANCSEICDFSSYHDYFNPTMMKACWDCRYGVCDVSIVVVSLNLYDWLTLAAAQYCIGPVEFLGSRGRILCSTCVGSRLGGHPKYQGKTEFPDCLCTDGKDPWLCRLCWKVKYFARWHGPADICVDCGTKVEDIQKEVSVCNWCHGKVV